MTEERTHNVVIHKANVPLQTGESIRQFTRALSDAGRDHVRKKLNLPDKGVDIFMVEAFAKSAVFDVFRFGPDAPKPKQRFIATAFTRKTTGEFEFGPTTEVQRVTTFQPKSAVPVAKAIVSVSKPFPNEHAARQKPPGNFKEFRRGTLPGAPVGISVVFGITGTGAARKSEIQSIRFDKDKFTVAQAKAWLKDHDFKTTGFEPATKPPKKSVKKTQFKMFGSSVNQWVETSKSFWNGAL